MTAADPHHDENFTPNPMNLHGTHHDNAGPKTRVLLTGIEATQPKTPPVTAIVNTTVTTMAMTADNSLQDVLHVTSETIRAQSTCPALHTSETTT